MWGITFDEHLKRLYTKLMEGNKPHWDSNRGYCIFFVCVDPDNGKISISYENYDDYNEPNWNETIDVKYNNTNFLITPGAADIIVLLLKGSHCQKTTTVNIKCIDGKCIVITDSDGICPNNNKLLGVRTFDPDDESKFKLGIFVPELKL
jgi:hypothetical protein